MGHAGQPAFSNSDRPPELVKSGSRFAAKSSTYGWHQAYYWKHTIYVYRFQPIPLTLVSLPRLNDRRWSGIAARNVHFVWQRPKGCRDRLRSFRIKNTEFKVNARVILFNPFPGAEVSTSRCRVRMTEPLWVAASELGLQPQ